MCAQLDQKADVISLVELDQYEEFFRPRMLESGYESVWCKRPRAASADGCGIFWHSGVFSCAAHDHMEFINREDAAGTVTKVRLLPAFKSLNSHRKPDSIVNS